MLKSTTENIREQRMPFRAENVLDKDQLAFREKKWLALLM
jgi:hypothetical protein